MIAVTFIGTDGEATTVQAVAGARLLDVAQACGQPLEGTCDGQLACSTCHVLVDASDFEGLPAASEEEEELLDLTAHVRRTSRLACQVMVQQALTVRIPG